MLNDKMILCAASPHLKKVYENPAYSELPAEIRAEVKTICVNHAEKLGCVFIIRFGEEGQVCFDTVVAQGDIGFDDIGAQLDIKRITREHKELIKSLGLWYMLYQTAGGKEATLKFLKENGSEDSHW